MHDALSRTACAVVFMLSFGAVACVVGCGRPADIYVNLPGEGVTRIRSTCIAGKTPTDLASAVDHLKRGREDALAQMHEEGRFWVILSGSVIKVDMVGMHGGEHVAEVFVMESGRDGPLPTRQCPGWVYSSWVQSAYKADTGYGGAPGYIYGPEIPWVPEKYIVTVGRRYVVQNECFAGTTQANLASALGGARGAGIFRMKALTPVDVITVRDGVAHVRLADSRTGWIVSRELYR